MSLESAKLFVEKIRNDQEFLEKVKACKNSEERQAFVKEAGFDFTSEEVQEVQMELTDEELDMIAGGSWLSCNDDLPGCHKVISYQEGEARAWWI